MPIQQATLEAPENRYLRLSAAETLRDALRNLVSIPPRAEPWHYLLTQRRDGSWLAVRFSWLVDLAEEDPGRLDRPLQELEVPAAQVVERAEVGAGEALRLARSAPGRVVVVMEDGRLAGLVCSGPTRGNGSFSAGQVEELVGPEEPKLETRYTDIGCPRRVTLGIPRFQVVVRLTIEATQLSRVSAAVELDTRQPVQIGIVAPDFKVLNSDTQEIPLASGRDSLAAVFDLQPLAVGHFEVSLDLFQSGNHLGTTGFEVEVASTPQTYGEVAADSLELVLQPAISPPDRILRITWNREHSTFKLSLIENGGTAWEDFDTVPLDGKQFSRQFYTDFKLLCWKPGDESDRRTFMQTLREAGCNLWQRLPEKFRNRYTQERQAWEGSSLLILSDEPYVPWELVWPDENNCRDAGPWGTTLRLSRWLRRDKERNGNLGARPQLALETLAWMAAEDKDAETREESRFLSELTRKHGLRNASPQSATKTDLLVLLATSTYDWLHITTHGMFEMDSADYDSVLRLPDRTLLRPVSLAGSTTHEALQRSRPAFFFNACHAGRLGWDWNGLAGWAYRLLAAGAGLFLAPLWEIEVASAFRFVQVIYPRILAGENIAEAVRQARQSAFDSGDASWLAYSLYAHPNARVRTPKTPA